MMCQEDPKCLMRVQSMIEVEFLWKFILISSQAALMFRLAVPQNLILSPGRWDLTDWSADWHIKCKYKHRG